MRAPDRCRDQKGTDRLMRYGKDDVDPRHHGGNAQQHLDAERAMNSRRRRTNAGFLDPARHDDQRNHRDPRPPAMDKMGKIGIIDQSIKRTLGGIDAIGIETVVHQWPCVGDISGIQASNPCTEEQLDK